jgi:uncharacterized protein (DUF433 family)
MTGVLDSVTADDLRFAPAYDIAAAGRYLSVPPSTMRNWFCGSNGGEPVLDAAARGPAYISFIGLTEAHVLSAIRAVHRVPLQRIRHAVEYLKRTLKSDHPLLTHEFQTDGLDLFVEELGSLINVSKSGQAAMREVVQVYLQRIDWDDRHLPRRLFPFTQTGWDTDPRVIVIDPRVAFGRPMIGRSGITTVAVAERFKAGESIESLANDFDRSTVEIEAAIRSELEVDTAA